MALHEVASNNPHEWCEKIEKILEDRKTVDTEPLDLDIRHSHLLLGAVARVLYLEVAGFVS